MKKLGAVLVLLLGMVMTVTGCVPSKISDSFNKEEVESKSKEVVQLLIDGKDEDVYNMLRQDVRETVTAEEIKAAYDKICGEDGAFKEFEDITLIGQKYKETGEDIGVAIIETKFEKGENVFTISFDTDMKLIGLYLK